MSHDPSDPITRGLDRLAGLADGDPVGDRMSGINRKARVYRRRKQAVGAAGLALVTAATAGILLLPNGDGARTAPPPAASPSTATETSAPVSPTPQPTASATGRVRTPEDIAGLRTDVTAQQIGPDTVGVLIRMYGTVPGGPGTIRVLLDGEPATGSPLLEQINSIGDGTAVCEPGAEKVTVDQTLTDSERKGLRVTVPGPGTYTIAVVAPFCQDDGAPALTRDTREVTVIDGPLVAVDETSVDLDDDGRPDRVRLLLPERDRTRGSGYTVAEVSLSSGETSRVLLSGSGVPAVAGEADLDGDGVPEVPVVSRERERESWTVLTVVDGDVVAAVPVGPGEQVVQPESGPMSTGGYQHTWLSDGRLFSWYANEPWDQASDAEVNRYSWVLDGGTIALSDPGEQACVTADVGTWSDPQAC